MRSRSWPGRGSTPWPDRSRGQATVELALGFPVVLVGILLVLQLVVVGRDQVLVTHATREAARAAAVDPGTGPATAGARNASTTLDPERLEVETRRRGGRITVTVRYRARTALPLVGPLLPDPVLHGRVTMHVEDSG